MRKIFFVVIFGEGEFLVNNKKMDKNNVVYFEENLIRVRIDIGYMKLKNFVIWRLMDVLKGWVEGILLVWKFDIGVVIYLLWRIYILIFYWK